MEIVRSWNNYVRIFLKNLFWPIWFFELVATIATNAQLFAVIAGSTICLGVMIVVPEECFIYVLVSIYVITLLFSLLTKQAQKFLCRHNEKCAYGFRCYEECPYKVGSLEEDKVSNRNEGFGMYVLMTAGILFYLMLGWILAITL